MNELANIPGNIVVVLTQQGITNARSSEEDHLKRFITILRGDYKSGKKKKLNNNQSAIQALKANERRHAIAKGFPYPTLAILDEF